MKFYYTFGSSEHFPFQDTYLVIEAENENSANAIFRSYFPDRHENTLNCAFVYPESQKDLVLLMYPGKEPAIVLSNKLSLTEQSLNCCGDLFLEADHVNATYELWFDADAYFGTNTREADDIWINFYTDWYPESGKVTATYVVTGDTMISCEASWPLTPEEEEFLKNEMEKHSIALYGKTLEQVWEEEKEHGLE